MNLGWPLGSALATGLAWGLIPDGVSSRTSSREEGSSTAWGGHAIWQLAWSAQGALHGWPGIFAALAVVNVAGLAVLAACLPESPRCAPPCPHPMSRLGPHLNGGMTKSLSPEGCIIHPLSPKQGVIHPLSPKQGVVHPLSPKQGVIHPLSPSP